MTEYVLKRIFLLIPVLLGVSFVVFLALHLTPGDPAQVMLGERASPDTIAALRKQLGLDEPFIIQYLRFISRIVRGNLGRAIQSNNLVIDELKLKFPATIELTIVAMIIASFVGMIAGIISAVRQYTFFDYISMTGALAGVSVPIFWLGLMMMIVFSIFLGWFPLSGRIDMTIDIHRITNFYIIDTLITRNYQGFKDVLMHLVLPGITLATVPMAIIARMTRASMLEVLRQDYIRTARAKGLAEIGITIKHALKNAFIPIVTVIGLQFGHLLGGAILTETIFAWPGVGRLTVDAIYARDYPLVQGCVLLVAVTFVMVNLFVDVLYAYLDPRIKYR